MPGIGIIANPYSKLNKQSPEGLRELEAISGQRGIFKQSQNFEHLAQILHEFCAQDIDILAINGGDGSLSRALSHLIPLYGSKPLPKICVLGGGTMNIVSSQIGASGSPQQLLHRLLAARDQGLSLETIRISTLKIGDIYGFLYADQSSTKILQEFYRNKKGHWHAFKLGMQLTQSFLFSTEFIRRFVAPHQLKANFEPTARWQGQTLGCFAGTVTKFPMGFSFLPLARKKPAHFQVTIVHCAAEKLLWYLPMIMLQQKEGSGLGRDSFCCQRATLDYEGQTLFTVDGEIYQNEQGPLIIESGPELEFVIC